MNTVNIRLEPVTMNDLPAWIDSKKFAIRTMSTNTMGAGTTKRKLN